MTPISTVQIRTKTAAMTLVEVLVSATLLSLILAGLTSVAGACRAQTRAQQETAAASYAVEQAFEELNGAGWTTLTDAQSLRTLMTNLDNRRLSELNNP